MTEGRLVDVTRAGFDAGVRAVDVVPPGVTIVPLNRRLHPVVVGSPAYFEKRPHPRVPRDLLHHACIRVRWPSGAPYEWEFQKDGKHVNMEVPGTLSLDNHSLIVSAALAGVGLAYTPADMIEAHLQRGELLAVLRDWVQPSPGFALYFPKRRQAGRLLEAFVGVIEELRDRGPTVD